MAQKFCIFLRGINVNGIKIKMKELKEVLIEEGYMNIQTVLATGNVILTTADDFVTKEELKENVEKVLSEHFKYAAHLIIMKSKSISDLCKVAETHSVLEGYHHYLLLCSDPQVEEDILALYKSIDSQPSERLIVEEIGLFWIVEKGQTLKSQFGCKILGSKVFKSKLTSRTMNTIVKINKLL